MPFSSYLLLLLVVMLQIKEKRCTVKPQKLELSFFEVLANSKYFGTHSIQRVGPIHDKSKQLSIITYVREKKADYKHFWTFYIFMSTSL